MEKYITGTGQVLNVHNKKDCSGHCCIHNPSNHHMKDWPTRWREDRSIMERICKCGVGHPDPDDLAFRKAIAEKQGRETSGIGTHGCCGCCVDKKKKENKDAW